MSRAGTPSAIDVFDAASRLPRDQREEYLRVACGGDPRLREEVNSLLKSLDGASGFLDKSLFGRPIVEPKTPTPIGGRTPTAASVSELVGAMAGVVPAGAVIGRYTIESVLGEGGMGVVYLAQQETPRRAVALKVIRPAVATPTMMKRFVREAELLGRLQHPGIAQIFEAGTADLGISGKGVIQPFLAMELIRGKPITDHARDKGLTIRERLEVVARLCDAVEHAHQRGLIHRDLKPANILVDTEGQPKILDFGVARAIDSPTPGATMATEVGTLIGTLAYMSPEQVGGDLAVVDTRSDIYALGVLLYELVCGKRPHDMEELGLFEAARRVREREPERPGSLRRELRGDIDTIILKAMAKDRDRRYASAGALREDLRRHLAGEPILARQDSALYVLRKSIRRHRGPVAAASLAVAALAAFGVYASVQSGREHEARLKAETEKQRADKTSERLADELHVSNVAQARWLMDNGTFVAAEDMLWREHLQRPDSELSRWALRDLYSHHPSLLSLPTENRIGRAMAMSRDGTLAAIGDAAGTVSMWRLSDGARLCAVQAGRENARSAAFDPLIERLATLGDDGVLRVWSLADPSAASLLGESLAHLRGGSALAYSPDGSIIATVGADRTLGIFDGKTGERRRMLRTINSTSPRLLSLAFDDAGTRIAMGGEEGGLFLVDLGTAPDTVTPFGDAVSDVQAIAFTHDGTRLLAGTGGSGQELQIWEIASKKLTRRFSTDNGTVRSIDLSPDDRLALTCGYWRSDILDLSTSRYVFANPSRPRGGFRARFLPGMDRVLSASSGETRLWELSPKALLARKQAHTRYLGKMSTSTDGSRVLTVGADGEAVLWDAASWRELLRIRRSNAFYCWIGAISPDGKLMAVVSRTGVVRLFDTANGAMVSELKGMRGSSADCAFSEDGHRLMAASTDGQILVWGTQDRSLDRELRASGREIFRMLRIKGDLIAVGQRSNTLPIWDVAAGAIVRELPIDGSSWCLAVTPDASRLAVGFFHGEVGIWDLNADRMLVTIDAHTRIVRHVSFSNDGTVLATTAGDGPAKLWNGTSGAFLSRLGAAGTGAADEPDPSNLLFLPRSSTFVVTYDNGRMDAWDQAYFDRHIAGNVEYQLQRHGKDLGEQIDAARVRAWAESLRAAAAPNPPIPNR